MPIILGNEAAGVVESVGPGVTNVKPGDRIAYVGVNAAFYQHTGAYAEQRNMPAARLIPLPDGISDQQAAAMMVKGLTASLIVHRVFRPKPGDVVLIHAAASGVGMILAQWAKHLGATVIGTVGSKEKAEIAAAHGCDHTILYRETDFVAAVKRIAPKGVHAVLDGVGKDTFMPSLDCLRPFGIIVNYGNASGHVPPLDILDLSRKGALSVSRPGLQPLSQGHRRVPRGGERAVRSRRGRHDQDRDQPLLSAQGCGRRAPRRGEPEICGLGRPDPLAAAEMARRRRGEGVALQRWRAGATGGSGRG